MIKNLLLNPTENSVSPWPGHDITLVTRRCGVPFPVLLTSRLAQLLQHEDDLPLWDLGWALSSVLTGVLPSRVYCHGQHRCWEFVLPQREAAEEPLQLAAQLIPNPSGQPFVLVDVLGTHCAP